MTCKRQETVVHELLLNCWILLRFVVHIHHHSPLLCLIVDATPSVHTPLLGYDLRGCFVARPHIGLLLVNASQD